MLEQENTRKSFLSISRRNSHRNFRRGLAIGALSFGVFFGSVAPAAAGPAADEKPFQGKTAASPLGQLLSDFLAAIWPGWDDARSLAGNDQEEGLRPVVSNSEGDSEIEIEPRNPRVPAPPPPVPFGGRPSQ